MNTNVHHGPAKIYQFPTRSRSAAGGHRDEPKASARPATLDVPAASVGDAWYHEEAVQEAARARKTVRLPAR